jgi:Beta-propeller repeat
VRTHHLLQLSLPVLAFLVACGETPNLRNTEGTGDTSTINGSVAASKAVDVDLEATMPIMRTQSTRLRAKTTTSNDAFNALLSLEGTSVLAVNADGQVLGSSPIASDGSFSIPTLKNQIVALMLANKGASGAWVCQQPLEYNDGNGSQTAVLKSNSSQIQAGRFSFKAATGRASSATNQATITPIPDPRFSSDSLDGYQRCGNPNVEEIVVRGDYNITWPKGLNANDPVRGFNRSLVFGLDTSVTGKPRFVGAGTVNAQGQLEIRLRHEAGTSVKLSPTIADERSFEALNSTSVLMPTWNMGIPASDVSKNSDFGAINAEIAQAKGDVVSSSDTAQVGASINANFKTKPGEIAQTQTMTGEPVLAGEGGTFSLLVPKPVDANATFSLKVVSLDKLEAVQDVLQPNKPSIDQPKHLKTQPLNSVRTWQFGTSEDDSIRAMTLDAQQNLFVLGETSGALYRSNLGGQDLTISKFAPDGTTLFSSQFGSSGNDAARALLVRPDGTLLVATYNSSLGQVGLVKLDSGGGLIWTGQVSIPNETNLNITSLQQDASGNVYIAGTSDGLQRSSGMDALVAMYSSANIDQNASFPLVSWSKTFTSVSSDDEEIRGLTFDSSQNLVMVGITEGSFGSGTSAGNKDLFITRFLAAQLGTANAPSSTPVLQSGTTSNDEASAIAADGDGNVYVTGFTGGGSGVNARHSGFLEKFDSSLANTWKRTLVTTNGTDAENVALQVDQDSIYVTGKAAGPVGTNSTAGGKDVTVVRYDATGATTWIKQFGSNADDAGQAVLIRNARVIVGGYAGFSLHGQIPFGKKDAVLLDMSLLGN